MLDKKLDYEVYSKHSTYSKEQPYRKYGLVKILYEDDISFYVECSGRIDGAGHGIRYSLKKHCFRLQPYRKVISATEMLAQNSALLRALETLTDAAQKSMRCVPNCKRYEYLEMEAVRASDLLERVRKYNNEHK